VPQSRERPVLAQGEALEHALGELRFSANSPKEAMPRWAYRMIRSGACSASCRDRSHPARAPGENPHASPALTRGRHRLEYLRPPSVHQGPAVLRAFERLLALEPRLLEEDSGAAPSGLEAVDDAGVVLARRGAGGDPASKGSLTG
jgi:hypothetical protein